MLFDKHIHKNCSGSSHTVWCVALWVINQITRFYEHYTWPHVSMGELENGNQDVIYWQIGNCKVLISVSMIVAWSTVWLTVNKTLEVKIFSELPVSPNIFSSHKMLNTSLTIMLSTLKGNCMSSLDEAMKLCIHELSAQLTLSTYLGPYPDTVKIQLTHLLLCNRSSVNI